MGLTLAVGWTSQFLLALILALAMKGRFVRNYVVFYVFVASLFVIGLVRFYFFILNPVDPNYYLVYWYTQFLIVSVGYALLWEIYSKILSPYDGAAKVARSVVGLVFALVWLEFVITTMERWNRELIESLVRFEQNLQTVQAGLLTILLLLVWYYSIPLGRNLRWMLAGYGLFITSRLAILNLQNNVGPSFNAWRYYLEPFSFLATLALWSAGLRAYHPNPIPVQQPELERDYQYLTRKISLAISRTKAYLGRILQP